MAASSRKAIVTPQVNNKKQLIKTQNEMSNPNRQVKKSV